MIRYLLKKIEPILIKIYRKISQGPSPNLAGDRDIEYSFVAANLPDGPGKALDFGSGQSYLGLLSSRKGFETTAFDLQEINWFYSYPKLNFIKGDILKENFPSENFDLIISCSTIEHVGLAGRYGVDKNEALADLKAIEILKKILKRGGIMILTIPVGKGTAFPTLHRVYGEERLKKLLNGFEILKKEFWLKDKNNHWQIVQENSAFNEKPKPYYYALGLFVLKKC